MIKRLRLPILAGLFLLAALPGLGETCTEALRRANVKTVNERSRDVTIYLAWNGAEAVECSKNTSSFGYSCAGKRFDSAPFSRVADKNGNWWRISNNRAGDETSCAPSGQNSFVQTRQVRYNGTIEASQIPISFTIVERDYFKVLTPEF